PQWGDAAEEDDSPVKTVFSQQDGMLPTQEFFRMVSEPCNRLEGDSLPVSAFTPDGRMPMGTTAYEKRRIAINVPEWDPEKCVECTECSLVCAHAAIRPFLLDDGEMAKAPAALQTRQGEGAEALRPLHYRIQVYPEDCTGCSSCATICPGHALTMKPVDGQLASQLPLLDFVEKNVTVKNSLVPRFTINGSQFNQPLLQFSGACAGCGETPYVKLLTQLFGERMIIANATGCSSIWGANYPSNAYCVRDSDGRGPAWGNSLFEDNAEYGYGMAVSCRQRRDGLVAAMKSAMAGNLSEQMRAAMQEWLDVRNLPDRSQVAGDALVRLIEAVEPASRTAWMNAIMHNADMLGKKSIWTIGGDGWAYDIGFAGLDHVLASGEDINILVMDTECYSNTGGQTSKATPLGAVTKYSPAGKRT
ncbi:MAG: 4Fe-4S dicluster domain-containing protein, partial [Muribaculaceae bacterium]|nr:4Fe-4S dicluster domain-containing protein [Muribaculaceae bacterium]